MSSNSKRRPSFGMIADAYDDIRPGYPDDAFEVIIKEANILPDSHLLEIGCGTGKATQKFIDRKYTVLCVEASESIGAAAQKKFSGASNFKIEISRFEDWDLIKKGFNLIFSAQAFHWVRGAIRYELASKVLKQGGFLAIINNFRVDLNGGLQTKIDKVLEEYFPQVTGIMSFSDRTEKRISDLTSEIAASDCFNAPVVFQYPWEERFSIEQYQRFLSVYSEVGILEMEKKKEIFSAVASVIEGNGGRVVVPYKTVVHLTQVKG